MSYTLLDGKKIAAEWLDSLRQKVAAMDTPPKLVVIIVGDDPASAVYVRNKEKACAEVGVLSEVIRYPATATQAEVLQKIEELNTDSAVNGMIVQLPLPDHFSPSEIIEAISPEKDADGFHPCNLGKILLSKDSEYLPPATPAGIIQLLEAYDIDVSGKNVVVIGRSNIVGKPISLMLLNRNATVTTCHSRTKDITAYTKNADIIVVSVGKPNILTADMVSKGAVVIDVGINRTEEGKLVGDVDFENVAPLCSAITPVPGGVGRMTVAALIANAVAAKEKQMRKKAA